MILHYHQQKSGISPVAVRFFGCFWFKSLFSLLIKYFDSARLAWFIKLTTVCHYQAVPKFEGFSIHLSLSLSLSIELMSLKSVKNNDIKKIEIDFWSQRLSSNVNSQGLHKLQNLMFHNLGFGCYQEHCIL